MLHTPNWTERKGERRERFLHSEKQNGLYQQLQGDDGHTLCDIVQLLMLLFGCSEVSEAETTCYRKRTKFSISFTILSTGFDYYPMLPSSASSCYLFNLHTHIDKKR
ncbi:hypothetical protein RJT34_10680 [Clitoria ternatea]|uniref:Uncharacterized protein n=1 Tax=Clitoria ternatea TaxID=43366 RepID=A0AAN9PJT5_CLITE